MTDTYVFDVVFFYYCLLSQLPAWIFPDQKNLNVTSH